MKSGNGLRAWIYEGSIIDVKSRNLGFHSAQKPIALMEYLIKTYTNKGDLVLDNCIGSGTTAIACVKTGRSFIGIEKEKKYVDIARQRIEEERQKPIQTKLFDDEKKTNENPPEQLQFL